MKLSGLDFKRKGSGSVVLDTRKNPNPPKFVGIIVRKPFKQGYMLCPFVLMGLTFNMPVPREFRSIQRAENWLLRHAVLWNKKRIYTPFNKLIWHVLADNAEHSPLGNWRFHIIFTHLLMCTMLFMFPAAIDNATVSLACYILAVGTGGYAIVHLLLFFRERL